MPIDTITTKQSLTDPTAYPAFATKVALMTALQDHENEHERDPMMLVARLANTDTSGWADPTAAIPTVTPGGGGV